MLIAREIYIFITNFTDLCQQNKKWRVGRPRNVLIRNHASCPHTSNWTTPPPLKLSSGNCCVVYPQLSSRLMPLRTQRATKSKSQFAENPLLPLMMYFALSVELLFTSTRSVGVGSLCPRIVFTFQQTLYSVDSLSLMQSTRAVCIMKDTSSSVFFHSFPTARVSVGAQKL